MEAIGIRGLYYITHIENLPSILQHGILSHTRIDAEGIEPALIYNAGIVERRREKITPDGRSLWDYANLFFQPRNAMLYRVVRYEKPPSEVVVICIKPRVLRMPGVLVTDGNAVHSLSSIRRQEEYSRDDLLTMMADIEKEYWKEEDGSKRKMMAECLVPDCVLPVYIESVYVAHHDAGEKCRQALHGREIEIIPEPHMFFQPSWISPLTDKLRLVDGDMFFSQMQTLTVSVNTVGVMGKGLASRVRYQFPGVYVLYEDLCRTKELRMGKPYLVVRESLEQELVDEPDSLDRGSDDRKQMEEQVKQFLLFPTKNHWQERADIDGIERGLREVLRNYRRLGITSLAVPALGCGLGWLKWEDVGPLLCRYLSKMDIQTAVYLPRERQIPEEALTVESLLGNTR